MVPWHVMRVPLPTTTGGGGNSLSYPFCSYIYVYRPLRNPLKLQYCNCLVDIYSNKQLRGLGGCPVHSTEEYGPQGLQDQASELALPTCRALGALFLTAFTQAQCSAIDLSGGAPNALAAHGPLRPFGHPLKTCEAASIEAVLGPWRGQGLSPKICRQSCWYASYGSKRLFSASFRDIYLAK